VRWLLAALLFLAASPVSAQTARAVRVGTYANEPLVFRDAGGAPQGVYIDLLDEIARKQGWSLRYVEGTWDECLQRLERGEIDLLVAIGYSEERTRLFDFNREPVVVNWGQVYVAPRSRIRSLLDLTGRTLAVLRGDVYYESLKRTQAILKVFPTFIEVDSYREALRLVAEGRAEAALVPRIFGAYHERLFAVEKTTIMWSPTELRFAAPKGMQGPLLETLDRELAALKTDKRSAYYRALNVWIEGVRTLVFPKWLNPFWVVGGAASVGILIVGMNLVLRRQVRLRTAALKASLAAQEKIASELRIAREIQMSSIPREYPALPGWDIHGVLQPAREVGGDFYDCALLDEGRLYVTLGDVSDKGVPAALFMAATKTRLGASVAAASSPAAVLTRVNRDTARNNDRCMFVTVWCGILDLGSGRITYANAGHNPPAVRRADGRVEFLDIASAPALGIDEDAAYREGMTTLEPGDVLVMYTDGVTEALDAREELFSEDRLQTELAASGLCDARDLAGRVLARVAAFAGDAPQADDIALLVLHRGPAGLRLASRLSELPRLVAEVARLGREHDLPEEVVSDLTLALEEAVSNVIRHGYGDRPDGLISVTFRATGESIVATVEDAAVGFDPLKHPEPDLTVPVEARPEGGMGVYLIKRLMDEVDYRVDDGRNVLTLTKRLRRATCH
jgi:serine phosphatase RsbU (regulator of sigma subunit)/anti-sigma regulatory factor (Ser/Thr protein kinase)